MIKPVSFRTYVSASTSSATARYGQLACRMLSRYRFIEMAGVY